MKKIILLALALLGMGTIANAQFYVVGQDGTILYKMDEGTPAYVTFEKPITGTENGHVWVDLGLSVKWATCNVGASTPEEFGGYYAWGETEIHYSAGGNTSNPTWKEGYSAGYDWSTYKWCKGSSDTMTKYCTSSTYGTVDNKTTLEKADDVATANWGDNWRIPTAAEWEELYYNTTRTWTNDYEGTGVKGYILTSTKEGHEGASIFLSAAGYRYYGNLGHEGSNGYYWSSSLDEDDSYFGRNLLLDSGGIAPWSYERFCGQSVRPVCQK